jgi:hypothetical protein
MNFNCSINNNIINEFENNAQKSKNELNSDSKLMNLEEDYKHENDDFACGLLEEDSSKNESKKSLRESVKIFTNKNNNNIEFDIPELNDNLKGSKMYTNEPFGEQKDKKKHSYKNNPYIKSDNNNENNSIKKHKKKKEVIPKKEKENLDIPLDIDNYW